MKFLKRFFSQSKNTTILQRDETDCAAACLAIIARHYGKGIPLDKIRGIAGTDREGTSGFGLVKAAEIFGFSCRGAYVEEKNLPHDIAYPCIVHVQKKSGEHYIVVKKKTKDQFYIVDPAYGTDVISHSELNALWTGIFFILLPEESFTTGEEYQKNLTFFLKFLRPHKKICVQLIISGVILSILGILTAFYFRFLIDEVLYAGLMKTLTVFSLGFLGAIIFRCLLTFARNHLLMIMSCKIDVALNLEYIKHVLRLPQEFFNARRVGEILARMHDTETIRHLISSTSLSVLLDSLMVLLGAAFLLSLGSKLTLIALIPVCLQSLLVFLLAKKYEKDIRRRAQAEAEKESCTLEMLNGIATVKALVSEDRASERVEFASVYAMRRAMKVWRLGNLHYSINDFISQCGKLAVYWYGGVCILTGTMSLGQLISFVILSGYFLEPLSRLLTLQPRLQEAFIAAERLNEIFTTKKEDAQTSATIPLSGIKGKVSVKDLCFSYGTRGEILKNVSLDILPGERVAFVGASGAGKSTIAKLLMKLYRGYAGDILIDDINIRDIKTEDLRSRIGYVAQDVLLFSGTIAENILWNNYRASGDHMVAAATIAGANDFIGRFPERYNTIVGEHGATVSGGERQRIAIARMLAMGPDMLILDEATASLDAISERSLTDGLRVVIGERTLIVIAHRLSTIQDCDRIFVFDKGSIVESGRHEELLALGAVYASLWKAQNRGSL